MDCHCIWDYGKDNKVSEDFVVVNVAENVDMKFQKASVSSTCLKDFEIFLSN